MNYEYALLQNQHYDTEYEKFPEYYHLLRVSVSLTLSDTNDQKGENETSEFCNFVAKFFLCSLFDRCSIGLR